MRGEDGMIDVLIADDHAAFRAETRSMLEAETEIRVVGEAGDGAEALNEITRRMPEVAILDFDMPYADGLSVARSVRERKLPVKLILLTVHCSESLVRRALAAGLDGYVVKDAALAELSACVQAVSHGHSYVSAPFSELSA
jgi:DNA-binding NarL/FixJ family response regulator